MQNVPPTILLLANLKTADQLPLNTISHGARTRPSFRR